MEGEEGGMEGFNVLVTSPCQGHEPVTQDIGDEPHGGGGAVGHVPGPLHLQPPGGVVQVDGHGAGHTILVEGEGDLALLRVAGLVNRIDDLVD